MSKKTNLIDSFLKRLRKIPKKNTKGIHEPQFDKKDQIIVSNCIKKNEVSGTGNYVKNFERAIASLTGSKYVIATSTGTSALHLALQANGVGKNHEVLVPAFNFIAAANAILYCGATPHFVEINKKNLGIDVDYLSNYLKKIAVKKNNFFINRKTKKKIYAIVPVYVFGNSYDVTKLLNLCKKYKIKIIEDSAEALGTFYKKKHAGTFGKAGCLSFNGNKIITTGLGGAVITNNHKLYTNIRDKVDNGKKKNTFELVYEQKTLNFRMASINAALGISQIKKLKKFLLLKKKLSNQYFKLFKDIKGVRYITEDKFTKSNHWLNAVEIDFKNNKQRIELFKKAKKLKIPIRPAWTPLNKLNYLKKFPKSSLYKSDKIYKKIICLPSSAILGQ